MFMNVSPSCYILYKVMFVTSKHVLEFKKCRNLLKDNDFLSAVSTFWFHYPRNTRALHNLQALAEPGDAIHLLCLPLIGSRIGPRIVCWKFFHDH